MKWFCLVAALGLLAAGTRGQSPPSSNYLVDALNSAMELKGIYDYETESFRARLTYQADDFGYYFTRSMRYAQPRATTQGQGAALQVCASVAASQSQESIRQFDEALRHIQQDSNQLQLSVYEQLQQTNIKAEDLELFYYYHSHRMEEARNRLYEVHFVTLGNSWARMWFDHFDIAEELDECLERALA